MQPDSISLREDREHGGKDSREDTDDWIETLVCILSGGDITKRDGILWGFTLEECKPYLKYRERQILFREAVIGFFTGGGKEKEIETDEEYMESRRQVNNGR